jgi:hypothetical protein
MQEMGVCSRLVLAKLGFDLRKHYHHLMSAPPPEQLQSLIERLPGRPQYVFKGTDKAPFRLSTDDASLV